MKVRQKRVAPDALSGGEHPFDQAIRGPDTLLRGFFDRALAVCARNEVTAPDIPPTLEGCRTINIGEADVCAYCGTE